MSGLQRNILQRVSFADSAALRACLTGQASTSATWRQVDCSESHFAEVIATGADTQPSQNDCEVAAGTYLNAAVTTFERKLVVTPLLGPARPESRYARCLIEVRGANPLISTVRGLSNSDVPVG